MNETEPSSFAEAVDTMLGSMPESSELSLADLAFHLLPLWQRQLDRVEAVERKAGRVPSCRDGCGVCCRQVVPLSLPEAFMLARHVDALPDARREAVLARFEQAKGRLDRAGLLGEPLLSRAHDYWALSIDCPFLEAQSCSIHPTRPSACREHLALDGPERCIYLDDGAPMLHFPERLFDVLAYVAARLLGGAPAALPLVLARDHAAANGTDAGRRWSVLELRRVFADVFAGAR